MADHSTITMRALLHVVGGEIYLADGARIPVDVTKKVFRGKDTGKIVAADELLARRHAKTNVLGDHFRKRFAEVAAADAQGIEEIGPPKVDIIFAAGELELLMGRTVSEISRVVLLTSAEFTPAPAESP